MQSPPISRGRRAVPCLGNGNEEAVDTRATSYMTPVRRSPVRVLGAESNNNAMNLSFRLIRRCRVRILGPLSEFAAGFADDLAYHGCTPYSYSARSQMRLMA